MYCSMKYGPKLSTLRGLAPPPPLAKPPAAALAAVAPLPEGSTAPLLPPPLLPASSVRSKRMKPASSATYSMYWRGERRAE